MNKLYTNIINLLSLTVLTVVVKGLVLVVSIDINGFEAGNK